MQVAKDKKDKYKYKYTNTKTNAHHTMIEVPKYKISKSLYVSRNNLSGWEVFLMKISKGSRSLWEDVQHVGK